MAEAKFAEGEKVLCFHGPLIYEAKCLKSNYTKDKNIRYLIHYAGWNKNWDEWVPENRVLKYNSANVQKQKEVLRVHTSQPPKGKKAPAKAKKSEAATTAAIATTPSREDSRASTPAHKEPEPTPSPAKERKEKSLSKDAPTDSGSDQLKKTRDRTDLSAESEKQPPAKRVVTIKLPTELNVYLVDDWDVITRQQKLALLPAKLTVNQILDNYLFYRKKKAHTRAKVAMRFNVVEGIKGYFNAALGSQLLYNFEIPQHNEVLLDYPDTPMSQIYGSIHLLRLFTKMGQMLSFTSLDKHELTHVLHYSHDLLTYMVTMKSTLFNLNDYGNAPSEYQEKV